MGREVRMVPADWQHPKQDGGYVPLLGQCFADDASHWDYHNKKWNEGFRQDCSNGVWKTLDGNEGCETYEEWAGKRPVESDYMPQWADEEKTHLMMYENTSEGTPISPAFKTAEELARWLADNGASSFANYTSSYEEWLGMIQNTGYSIGCFVTGPGGFRTGVQVAAETPEKPNQ